MKKRNKLLLVVVLLAIILGTGFWGISVWLENEKEHAVQETKQYMKESYPSVYYQIKGVSVSHGWGEFKHYGYYAYEVMVEDTLTGESFGVYYDRSMKHMDDSKHIDAQEEWCTELEPAIEQYVIQHFGKSQSSTMWYDLETKEPFIQVILKEEKPFITKAEWERFQTFLKNQLGIKAGLVSVEYGFSDKFWETQL